MDETPDADYRAAREFLRLGSLKEAIATLSCLVQQGTQDFRSFYALGYAWALQGDDERAARCYERATQLAPGFAGAWSGLGQLSVKQEKFDSALRCYFEALKCEPHSIEHLINISSVYALKNDNNNFRAVLGMLRRHARYPEFKSLLQVSVDYLEDRELSAWFASEELSQDERSRLGASPQ
jgi:tetratricopeptide (TPR) repeat protein